MSFERVEGPSGPALISSRFLAFKSSSGKKVRWFFPEEPPIDAAPIAHALKRRQEAGDVVIAMPKATYRVEGFQFGESRSNHLEVFRAGWCRTCKHRLSGCECRDVQAGHHDPRELDFDDL